MHVLNGIRAMDFTSYLNGAYAAMFLSDMGADVVKIEPPEGDSIRNVSGAFMACNRGKRSLSIDLKKPEAKEIIHKLVAKSDFLVENARWGVWHRAGLDYDSVVKIKSDIVYLSILGHGSTGPDSAMPAYDPLLQCRSGQTVTQGGLGKPPVFLRIAINDMNGPLLGAYGAMLAHLSRLRNGKGQHVETSLANASIVLQSGDFIDYPGMKRKYNGGTDIRGLNATHRLYQCSDGRWLFILCASERQWQDLCRVVGLGSLPSDPRFASPAKRAENDAALVEALSAAFRAKPTAEWIAALRRLQVPVAMGQTLEEVIGDPNCRNMFNAKVHPQLGRVRTVGVLPRFSEMTGVVRRPSPLLGEHTEEVLSELGYTAGQIAQLKANKIVFSGVPSA